MVVTCVLVLALPACGQPPASSGGGDAVTIGLLLPFTGGASATTSNFERAVLYAGNRINAGGGVRGRRVRVVSQAGWDEIESGLARLRAGSEIYYSGLTGPMLLDSCGQRRLGVTTTWQVQTGAIVDRAD